MGAKREGSALIPRTSLSKVLSHFTHNSTARDLPSSPRPLIPASRPRTRPRVSHRSPRRKGFHSFSTPPPLSLLAMIIPVRCFSCGKVVGDRWTAYLQLLESGHSEGSVLASSPRNQLSRALTLATSMTPQRGTRRTRFEAILLQANGPDPRRPHRETPPLSVSSPPLSLSLFVLADSRCPPVPVLADNRKFFIGNPKAADSRIDLFSFNSYGTSQPRPRAVNVAHPTSLGRASHGIDRVGGAERARDCRSLARKLYLWFHLAGSDLTYERARHQRRGVDRISDYEPGGCYWNRVPRRPG